MPQSREDKINKIVYVVNDLRSGGAERVVATLATTIHSPMFPVEVWCIRKRDSGSDTLSAQLTQAGIPVRFFGTQSFFPSVWLLYKALLKKRPDVVHAHMPLSILRASAAAFFARVPVMIAHYHNTQKFNSTKTNLLLKITYYLCDLHVCYTDVVEKELFGNVHVVEGVDTLRSRSCTIFNPVDIEGIEKEFPGAREAIYKLLSLRKENMLIVSTARLIPWKGQHIVIQAFAQIYDRFPHARLCIVGDGPERENLEQLSQTLGISDKVFFVGVQARPYLFLHAADIFALPYIYPEDILVKEAAGVAILEAAAAGCACVVSDYPSLDKFMQKERDVLAAVPGDPTSVAFMLARFLEDPALRKRLGLNAQSFIKSKMTAAKIGGIYKGLYRILPL